MLKEKGRIGLAVLLCAVTMPISAPASAAPPTTAVTTCALADITPNALACQGYYAGNLLSNNSGDITAQTTHLAALGFAWDGNWNTVEKISGLSGSHLVDFLTPLSGVTFVAFHFGGGTGGPGNATAFYKFNAGTLTDVINLGYNASSNAVLYSTQPLPPPPPPPTGSVPEPASWAMMIAGFGMVGAAARSRRRVAITA